MQIRLWIFLHNVKDFLLNFKKCNFFTNTQPPQKLESHFNFEWILFENGI